MVRDNINQLYKTLSKTNKKVTHVLNNRGSGYLHPVMEHSLDVIGVLYPYSIYFVVYPDNYTYLSLYFYEGFVEDVR